MVAAALAAGMASADLAAAAGWELRDFETPLGDTGVALSTAARRLLAEEAKSPDATVTVEIAGVTGKPVPVTFALAGLGAKADALAKRCADWELK